MSSTYQTPVTAPTMTDRLKDPKFEAFFLLRTLFTVAPILFGLWFRLSCWPGWPRPSTRHAHPTSLNGGPVRHTARM